MNHPTIFHDHLLGQHTHLKTLLQRVETGTVEPPEFREFFQREGYYHYSLMRASIMLLHYRRYGQQTFLMGPKFRELLSRTSIQGVPVSAIKLPYPVFYIALADCPWLLWGGDTGFHNLTGILVGLDIRDEQTDLTFFLWGEENHKSRVVGDDASFWFTLNLGEALSLKEAEGDINLESYVRKILKDPNRDRSDYTEVNDEGPESSKQFMVDIPDNGPVRDTIADTAANVVRVVINLLIYLQSVGAQQDTHETTTRRQQTHQDLKALGDKPHGKQKKRKRKLENELERLSEAHITWIGKQIEQTSGAPRAPQGKAIHHWVRGHWWPRLDNREAIDRHGIHWRQPYERNKESEGSMPSREYRPPTG